MSIRGISLRDRFLDTCRQFDTSRNTPENAAGPEGTRVWETSESQIPDPEKDFGPILKQKRKE